MKKIICLYIVASSFLSGLAHAETSTPVKVNDVITASNAFINSLDKEQQSMVIVDYTQANAVKWTNLPCGLACRVGIMFGSLSPGQLTLAKAVAKAALGAKPGTGYDQYIGIMEADADLGKNREGYSSNNYIIAFLGRPSASGKWQLQLGGHHLAINLSFNGGKVTGASPNFMGLEPPENNTLKANHNAMIAMLNALNSEQLAKAKLQEGFADVLVGPGKDGKFPATKSGLQASSLNKAQKVLIVAAMRNWVQIADNETAASILGTYSKQLDDTYISYFGNRELNSKGDYVRIDGPGVWIEFICQPGAVYPQGIHYHTVYRDHLKDYGGNFEFK
ncbi:MAG: DUF3500 domain-containing protein [Bacteroidota bacterium]